MKNCSAALIGLALLLVGPTHLHAETLRIGGSGAGIGLLRVLSDAYVKQNPGVKIEIVPSLGSSGGISAVSDRTIDIAVSGRRLNSKEASPTLRQVPFVESPFLFVTSHQAPPNLPLMSIIKFYNGEAKVWPDGTPMRLVLRPKSDAATLFMIEKIDGMAKALEVARARPEISVAPTDQDNLDMAVKIKGSLATMTLTQLKTEHNTLKPLEFNGEAGELDNFPNPAYPLRYRQYLVFAAQPTGAVQEFVTFCGSAAASAIINKNGGFVLRQD